MTTENTQTIDDGNNAGTPPGAMRPVFVRDIRGAKRLLGRLIVQFQRGTVDSQKARTMAYLLSTFCEICNHSDIEGRIKLLEERVKNGPEKTA